MRRHWIKDGDVIAGALTAALGAYVAATASRWTIMGPEGPGPGFFPLGYGIALVGLSIALIASRLAAPVAQDKSEPVDWPGFARAALTWAIFVAAAALMNTLGFYLAFGIMTAALVRLVFERPLRSALVVGFLSALGFYLVFGLALDAPLPVGLLGF